MTIREDLIQAVREVVMVAASLTDAKCIPADDNGPRPALPYLTVRVSSPGRQLAHEGVGGISGASPTLTQRGWYEARCDLVAYGRGGEEWLDLLVLRLSRENVQAECATRGISIDVSGAAVSTAQARDTSIEEVAALELTVAYRVTDTAETLAELVTVEASISLDRYTGDPEAQAITATLTP